MEIGCSVATSIESAFADGLRGLGIDPVEDVAPTVVAGPTGDLPEVDLEADDPWIIVELGGMGGVEVAGVEGAISVLHPDGPCPHCLNQRVRANDPATSQSAIDDTTARFAGAVAGRLLHRHGPDGLDAIVGQIQALDGRTHEVLPLPNCRCETGRSVDDVEAATGSALERAERAVDDRVGLIPIVGEQASFPAPYYVAELADTEGFSSAQAARHAGGIDLDWDSAFMRALGEALERYCAGVYQEAALSEDADGSTVELSALPIAKPDGEPVGRWWPATDMHTEETVQLPMETVVFPPPADADIDAITTGLGLGSSWTEALLAGVLEVIERDACMLGWYSTFEPLELAVDSSAYQTLERRMAGEGLATTSLLVTQDIDVPVVTAVVHRRGADGRERFDIPGTDPDDWPAFAVGSAAALDATSAAERALAEAVQNWVELREMGPERAEDEGAIAEFARFPRQARSLVDAEATIDAADAGPDGIESPADALDHCLSALESAGLTAYGARTTTRDVAALGFEGARVVVPAAQPLVQHRRHQTDRLRNAPRELGFQPRLDRGPHPYP